MWQDLLNVAIMLTMSLRTCQKLALRADVSGVFAEPGFVKMGSSSEETVVLRLVFEGDEHVMDAVGLPKAFLLCTALQQA
jgi:hypothetical protein